MSNVVATESFSITMERKCLCPLIVTHGVDQAGCTHGTPRWVAWTSLALGVPSPAQVPISSRFSMREDRGEAWQYQRWASQVAV